MKETTQKQLINKIKSVNNILVTVSRDPSVDELASALALTLALNKLGKRSVAVFSGQIPRSIHFLNPEKTFEDNADSLRDFIISLSKDKADRLKVRPDGDFVKVYITPYRTKITPDDLRFDEGDFNIELIVAIGVSSRDELDASIASHGKIFHNAVTATLNLGQLHDALGMISWQDSEAGCYAQMCYELVNSLNSGEHPLIDEPVATALLTGVVAATDQFRNAITSPAIMTLSANLMSKGANQQLITSELEAADETTSLDNERSTNSAGGKRDQVGFDRNNSSQDDYEDFVDVDNSNDPIERRLQTDRRDLSRRHGVDALHATQASLLERTGSIDASTSVRPTPSEAPRLSGDEQIPSEIIANNHQEFATEPAKPQEVSPAQSVNSTVEGETTSQPQSSPASSASTRSQYVEDPLAQMNGLATVADGATMPTSSGSYLIGGEAHGLPQDNASGVSPSTEGDDLPFRQPNQVSPIPEPTPVTGVPAQPQAVSQQPAAEPVALPPLPDLSQPLPQTMPQAMPAATPEVTVAQSQTPVAPTNLSQGNPSPMTDLPLPDQVVGNPMQTISTVNPVANSMPLPPMPPAPETPISATAMPPVVEPAPMPAEPSQTSTSAAIAEPSATQPLPQPATQAASADPGQFVIPS